MPTTLGKTTPSGWTSPDHAKEQTDAARRRDQKNQSKQRRRAELTPSNQDVAKALDTQSRRRTRAERSPEDKDQANAERRVKRRYDKDSPDRRAQKNRSQRRRRAELTPSNKDVAKALDTQSRRRKRAELSPEDKDQANEERRVKRRIDKESKEVTTAQGPDRQVKARAAKTRALASIHLFKRSTEKPRRRRWPWD